MPEVSAVVVNYNGDQDIMRCLGDLVAVQPSLAELIVVDNGSSDGSPEAIRDRFPGVDLVELGYNAGPAIARNIGLKRAVSPLVLFVDDDVYLEPDCLQRLLDCRQRETATVVAPRLVLLPEMDQIQADGADIHFTGTMQLRHSRAPVQSVAPTTRPIGAFSTSCVLADRTCLLDVGGFDESFFIYQEDMELALRLRSFGYRIYCDASAVALHDRGTGTPGLSFRDQGHYPRRRAYLTLRNRTRMVLLHYRLWTLLVLSPALMLYEFASLVMVVRKGWLGSWLRSWYWQLSHLPSILKRRHWIQSRRRVEDVQLLQGGLIPLAPGVLGSGLEVRLVQALSAVLDVYWRACRFVLPRGRHALVEPATVKKPASRCQ